MTADNGSGARLEIAGYASVFNIEDHSGDIVRPGAFADSLAKRGADGIRHAVPARGGRDPSACGTRVREDARGLYVRGHILETTVGRGAATAALIPAKARSMASPSAFARWRKSPALTVRAAS